MTDLKKLQQQYADWRSQYNSNRGRIPTQLKRQTLALLKDYSNYELTQALGLGNSTISKWKKAEEPQSSNPTPLFVTLPRGKAVSNSETFNLIQCSAPLGHQTLEFALTPAQLRALILGEAKPC